MVTVYRMESADELIEAREKLQSEGYELVAYDQHFETETWVRGEHEFILQFIEDYEEEQ